MLGHQLDERKASMKIHFSTREPKALRPESPADVSFVSFLH
jgi:hypothetical protein